MVKFNLPDNSKLTKGDYFKSDIRKTFVLCSNSNPYKPKMQIAVNLDLTGSCFRTLTNDLVCRMVI